MNTRGTPAHHYYYVAHTYYIETLVAQFAQRPQCVYTGEMRENMFVEYIYIVAGARCSYNRSNRAVVNLRRRRESACGECVAFNWAIQATHTATPTKR